MSELEINFWWPHLSAAAKDALDAAEGGRIPSVVRDEVERLTGVRMPEDHLLTEADRDFIRTQREAVD